MIRHHVYFWLNEDVSDVERARFKDDLGMLASLPTVRQAFIGVPAPTPDRPVVDHSFSCSLALGFDDVASHDAYQEHPDHAAFSEHWKRHWARVLVFDATEA